MTFFCKLIVAMFLVTCGLFCATPAKADPLVFSNVRLGLLGTTPPGGIDLFSNQGIVITSPQHNATISILVTGTIPAGGDILRLTATATNENGTFVLTN